jgi:hypothetical protein
MDVIKQDREERQQKKFSSDKKKEELHPMGLVDDSLKP